LALELLEEGGLGGGVGGAEDIGKGALGGLQANLECWPVLGTELRISFWWAAERRVSRVKATEMPMEPPMFRKRL
jgi:hypothetical protein